MRRFLRTAARTGPELEVKLDDDTAGALEQEAERQAWSASRLAEHAPGCTSSPIWTAVGVQPPRQALEDEL